MENHGIVPVKPFRFRETTGLPEQCVAEAREIRNRRQETAAP
jgi:hypothetical protein